MQVCGTSQIYEDRGMVGRPDTVHRFVTNAPHRADRAKTIRSWHADVDVVNPDAWLESGRDEWIGRVPGS